MSILRFLDSTFPIPVTGADDIKPTTTIQSTRVIRKVPPPQTLFGVSMHPQFGGWFAFRCVMIFPQLRDASFTAKRPDNIIEEEEKQLELLKSFTFDWKSDKYRDFIPVKSRYSQTEREYFATKPGVDRLSFLVNRYIALKE